jgi:hypothetical protein
MHHEKAHPRVRFFRVASILLLGADWWVKKAAGPLDRNSLGITLAAANNVRNPRSKSGSKIERSADDHIVSVDRVPILYLSIDLHGTQESIHSLLQLFRTYTVGNYVIDLPCVQGRARAYQGWSGQQDRQAFHDFFWSRASRNTIPSATEIPS